MKKVFDSVENSGDRVGAFTVCADTAQELYRRHNEIVKRIKVIGKMAKTLCVTTL